MPSVRGWAPTDRTHRQRGGSTLPSGRYPAVRRPAARRHAGWRPGLHLPRPPAACAERGAEWRSPSRTSAPCRPSPPSACSAVTPASWPWPLPVSIGVEAGLDATREGGQLSQPAGRLRSARMVVADAAAALSPEADGGLLQPDPAGSGARGGRARWAGGAGRWVVRPAGAGAAGNGAEAVGRRGDDGCAGAGGGRGADARRHGGLRGRRRGARLAAGHHAGGAGLRRRLDGVDPYPAAVAQRQHALRLARLRRRRLGPDGARRQRGGGWHARAGRSPTAGSRSP